MNIINKDILTIDEGVIVHQVNCRKAMGKGIAFSIRNKYPNVYIAYKARPTWNLGDVQFVCVEYYKNAKPKKIICNLAGQDGYGYGMCFTNYTALREGLKKVNEFSNKFEYQIYIPYKMGCGNAGGEWQKVLKIIKEECSNAIICKI